MDLPLGRRIVIPGDNPTNAMAAATARFFASLDPAAPGSVLSSTSRREMTRTLWTENNGNGELHYGLGLMSGRAGRWDWFGHGGAFQSCFSNTLVFRDRGLAVTVLSNAMDGMAKPWSEGIAGILQVFENGGDARLSNLSSGISSTLRPPWPRPHARRARSAATHRAAAASTAAEAVAVAAAGRLERVKGIEPSSKAWEAFVLPLNYTRLGLIYTPRVQGHQPRGGARPQRFRKQQHV